LFKCSADVKGWI